MRDMGEGLLAKLPKIGGLNKNSVLIRDGYKNETFAQKSKKS